VRAVRLAFESDDTAVDREHPFRGDAARSKHAPTDVGVAPLYEVLGGAALVHQAVHDRIHTLSYADVAKRLEHALAKHEHTDAQPMTRS